MESPCNQGLVHLVESLLPSRTSRELVFRSDPVRHLFLRNVDFFVAVGSKGLGFLILTKRGLHHGSGL